MAASSEPATASRAQQLFSRPTFRVYTSADVLGVELGGALKNVIAIAAGIGDGLGFGHLGTPCPQTKSARRRRW